MNRQKLQKKPMMAGCPNCREQKVISIKVPFMEQTLQFEEVLVCKGCQMMVSVTDLKRILLAA